MPTPILAACLVFLAICFMSIVLAFTKYREPLGQRLSKISMVWLFGVGAVYLVWAAINLLTM